MDSSRDSERESANISDDKIPMASDGQGVSRRKFTRNALVGSAVLLTLSNRSAWGATACISTSLLTSYAQAQASRPLNPDQQVEFDRYSENYFENRSDEYLVGDQTCYDYETDETNTGTIEIIDLRATPPAK